MPLQVDDEAVLTQTPLGGAGLELGQVDVPSREVAQDPVQAAGPVAVLEAHDAGLVVAGRGRDTRAGEEDEAGLVLGMVLYVRGQHLEPVELGGQRGAYRSRGRRSLGADE